MKKLLAIMLAAVMALSIAGCAAPAAQETAAGDDPFRQGDDQFLADNTWNDDFDAGFGDDDIGSDDDSWV